MEMDAECNLTYLSVAAIRNLEFLVTVRQHPRNINMFNCSYYVSTLYFNLKTSSQITISSYHNAVKPDVLFLGQT